jgi:hypothetical protein
MGDQSFGLTKITIQAHNLAITLLAGFEKTQCGKEL